MKEVHDNLWKYDCPIKVVTTNGDINRTTGRAVMGRGVALQVRRIVPNIDKMLASHIRQNGNEVGIIAEQMQGNGEILTIVSFPVKHHWHEDADLKLIGSSASALRTLVGEKYWPEVVMPRPGCGNGRLRWEDVKPVIEPQLDHRFTVVHL